MKIYVKILMALAAISAGVVCYAEDTPVAEQNDWKKMQIRFGAGLTSWIVMDNFDTHKISQNFLEGYYRDFHGTIKSPGSYGIGFQYYFSKFFSVGVDASVDIIWCNLYDPVTKTKVGRATGVPFTFLPQVRFNYLNRPKFRLYSAASLGFIAYFGNYPDTGNLYAEIYGAYDNSVEFAWQLSPLGCEYGKNVFYFAELGIGYLYTLARIGIGYRF